MAVPESDVMTAEETLLVTPLCLRVSTDGDPSVLTRVLGIFQHLNITPRRVFAEFAIDRRLHVRIDIVGLTEERLTLITAKVEQNPSVLNAYWHRL